MQFQLEQIISVKGKIYLSTRTLDTTVRFKLSDNSLLGDLEIENWFDIPKAKNERGEYRTDVFVFALKKEANAKALTQGEILKLSNLSVIVIESAYTVSGNMLSLLECGTGMLEVDTILYCDEKKWSINKNGLQFGRIKNTELQNQVRNNLWFFYQLQPIGHSTYPKSGSKLIVFQDKHR